MKSKKEVFTFLCHAIIDYRFKTAHDPYENSICQSTFIKAVQCTIPLHDITDNLIESKI